MRTVERRSCSAISPNPGMVMLFRPMSSFGNDDVGLLKSAAANEFERKRFTNGLSTKLAMNVLEPRDGMVCESDKNVADDDAGFVRRTFGLDFQNNGGRFVVAFDCFSKRIRQTHGL